jgi:hypothetical protein
LHVFGSSASASTRPTRRTRRTRPARMNRGTPGAPDRLRRRLGGAGGFRMLVGHGRLAVGRRDYTPSGSPSSSSGRELGQTRGGPAPRMACARSGMRRRRVRRHRARPRARAFLVTNGPRLAGSGHDRPSKDARSGPID